MENYKLKERLRKGGQSSVYLVEHIKEDNKQFVLKKVECFDESEANKAFNEALALQKLDHPYVCGYKEFFVMWDKEESSMFLCIVMDYYSKGDLRSIINDYQAKKIPVPEETIKTFLGEVLEALVYVHRNGFIHRDLKPSNIFVKDDDMLCLGDFGVSTVMGDLRTCPRNTVGTMVYMAPEVMTQAYDERSDVWSLGCMLLELTTTAVYDQKQLSEKLLEIKKDSYILEEVFEDIAKNYSDDWIKTIRTMLKVKHQARPTAEALLKMGFVMECVEARDSSLLDKRKRQTQTVNRKRHLSEGQDNPEHIIQYIADTIDHGECVKEGLEALRHLLDSATSSAEGEGTPRPPVVLDQASKNLITLAMWDNMDNKDLQIAGCAVLTALVINADANDILFTPEVLSVVGKVMKAHRGCSEVQQMAAAFILALSANNRASEALVQLGAIQDILAAMRDDPDNSGLVATCCNALWALTILESNAKVSAEENAIKEVCLALQKHVNSSEVAEAAAAAMISLCLDESCFETVNSMDGVGILLRAMETHMKSAKVVKNICMVLTTLVEPNEECAYRVLTSDKPDDQSSGGIPIIIKAYELHRDNAEVVEAIVNLIMELCEYDGVRLDLMSYGIAVYLWEVRAKYHKNKNENEEVPLHHIQTGQSKSYKSRHLFWKTDDVNAEMRHIGVGPNMLSEVYRRYKENRDIMGPCEQALDKLGAGKAMAPRRTADQAK